MGFQLGGFTVVVLTAGQVLSQSFWADNSFYLGMSLEFLLLAFVMNRRLNYKLVGMVEEKTHQLAERTQELQETIKIKDKFFSIIAHDLRGPVGSMLVVFQLIQSGKMKFESTILDHIITSTGNIKHLLEDLLSWAQGQQGKLKPAPKVFSLESTVIESIKLLEAAAINKQITLSNQVNPGHWVWADPAMITTVVRNLINNAIKFTHSGGSVRVQSRIESGKCILEVIDTGIGISVARQSDLFTLKQSTKSSTGTSGEVGNGLGLLLFKDFIEANSGSYGLKSDVGKGSTFWFSLPQADPKLVEQQASPKVLPPQIAKILIVEDTPLHLTAAEAIMQALGADYDTATDGEAALSLAGVNPYQVILMDIDLPKVNGIEATKLIRKVSPAAKIVAVTGYSKEEIAQKFGTVQFDGYLPKPLYKEKLLLMTENLFPAEV